MDIMDAVYPIFAQQTLASKEKGEPKTSNITPSIDKEPSKTEPKLRTAESQDASVKGIADPNESGGIVYSPF